MYRNIELYDAIQYNGKLTSKIEEFCHKYNIIDEKDILTSFNDKLSVNRYISKLNITLASKGDWLVSNTKGTIFFKYSDEQFKNFFEEE